MTAADDVITAHDPRDADVRALLERHLAFANTHSPPEDVHALDVDGLVDPAVSFFGYRRDGVLLAVGAMKDLGDGHAEIKSMHTVAEARGQGIAATVVDHLLVLAHARGYVRVSLETGSMDAFRPARALYASRGFEVCPPFADYPDSPNSTCMTLALTGET